jgi:hypothetical protein
LFPAVDVSVILGADVGSEADLVAEVFMVFFILPRKVPEYYFKFSKIPFFEILSNSSFGDA